MAVFTTVQMEEAQALAQHLNLGQVLALTPCAGGIENTNYFLDTTAGHFVLTVFERLQANQLPFYLNLLACLKQQGVLVPSPQADACGQFAQCLHGKPASVVTRLKGRSVNEPHASQCAQVGRMLARMHQAALHSPGPHPEHSRGPAWWTQAIDEVLPYLSKEQAALIQDERSHQASLTQDPRQAQLPRGLIHADLFRDNVLFEGEQLSGFFDFYFAGVDTWLLDVAICLNDWCIVHATGQADEAKQAAFLAAYEAVRPFTPAEHALLPSFLRAAALRFWTSRLWDWHLPRQAALLKAHDPAHFERVLRVRRGNNAQ
jgi:homoserine kinase type II